MSGSAGLSQPRSLKQEIIISSEHAQSLSKDSADHVVGPVALIVEIIEATGPNAGRTTEDSCAPGRARVAKATYDQLWWLIVDLEVQVLYGP